MVRGLILFFLTAVFISAAPVCVRADYVLVHEENGCFNRAYNDERWIDRPKTTFSVFMMNAGVESGWEDERRSFGFGFVTTQIDGGSVLNKDRYVVQPRTAVFVPYSFGGYDFGFWGCELGVSGYIVTEREDSRQYASTDGSAASRGGGLVFARVRSHAFVNARAFLLPQDRMHLEITIGRREFNAVDSLMQIRFFVPREQHLMELYVAAAFPAQMIAQAEGRTNEHLFLTNQRFGFRYQYRFSPVSLGASLGYLIGNGRGGGGAVPFTSSFSFGVSGSVSW